MPDLLNNDKNQNTAAPKSVPITPIAPAWASRMQPTTDTDMPGQDAGLAADLAQGGYGAGKDIHARAAGLKKWLQSIFTAQPSYRLGSPPAPQPPQPPVTPPVTPPVAPVNPDAWKRRIGYGGGRNSR